MKDIEHYLDLAWTTRDSVRDDDGRYFVRRVEELPGFVVAARSKHELEREYPVALRAFIESYLEDGQEPPLPSETASLTWTGESWEPATVSSNSSAATKVAPQV